MTNKLWDVHMVHSASIAEPIAIVVPAMKPVLFMALGKVSRICARTHLCRVKMCYFCLVLNSISQVHGSLFSFCGHADDR